ncbi:hypothetical protein Btru_057445 [Bulinus truncatus]|nr:hypothetical protein Btru_057445 [Bulinus truncatus]
MVTLHRSLSIATLLLVFLGMQEVWAVFTDCGGQLSFQAGNIISPNFPSSYPNDAECKWLISVADNQIIDFRFKRLDLDRYYDQNCIDYVRIYNGPTEQDPLIGTYCGYNDVTAAVNIIVRSKTNELLVVFKSDASGTKTGFSATYWAHECLPFKYGMEICNNSCACNATNAYYCDNHYGTCQCNSNWTGRDCSDLIPHCLYPNDCTDPYGICVNVPGRFECNCKPGLVKNERGECQECPSWTYGENCAYWASCDPYRTESYNKTNGLCSCYLNWTSTYCSQDVDECASEKSPCNTTHGKCLNTYGSYECMCMAGYETFNGVICNECGQTLLAPAGKIQSGSKYGDSQSSVECSWRIKVPEGLIISMSFQRYNMYGSWWYCTEGYIVVYDGSDANGTLIYSGYKPTVSTLPSIIRSKGNEIYIIRYKSSCGWTYGFDAIYWSHECHTGMYDSNCSTPCKCVLNNSECDSVSGKCNCHPGWTSTDCSVDINECHDITICPDYSTCHNLPGSYECRCWDGMVMDSNNQCITDNASSVCTNRSCSHVCVTVKLPDEVSLVETCYCPSFMELDGDQCVDCIGLKHGRYCQENCLCNETNTASCNPVTGQCHCYHGWKGYSCDQDDNECLDSGKFSCPTYSYCVNTPGSYRCECDTRQWYLDSDSGSCAPKQCDNTMTNSSGEIMNPYYPENPPRYVKCTWNITVDEGYVVTIRFTTLFNPYTWWYSEIAAITFYDGIDARSSQLKVYRYSPPNAFVRSTGNQMYIVFEESNTNVGLFYGMYMAEDCPKNMYGDSCSTFCPCVANNSICNNVDGTCKCLTGWTGSDCSLDVNECLQDYICPLFSKCYNNYGSYECRCYDGLMMNSNRQCVLHENSTACTEKHCQFLCARFTPENQTTPIEQCYCQWHMELDGDKCVECKGFKYGVYCDKQCDCPQNTSASCNVYNGVCLCMSNWIGYQCNYDYDECLYGRYSCPPHTYCSNTWGGYNCLCNPSDGYTASGNGSCARIECNHEMNNVTGIVSAGNNTNSAYTNNAYCTWKITAEKGNVVSLR